MQASPNSSYCGPPPLPDDLWGRWNFDPWLIGTMLLVTAIFVFRPTTRHQQLAFAGAMTTLAIVFISPLCALTVSLFSARVVHHVLLVAVAAPFLATTLQSVGKKTVGMLAVLAGLHAAIFWLWHAPDAYQFALADTSVYWLMQITLLGSATALWLAIFAATPGKSISTLLFLTIQMGLLGALLVFSSQPLYLPHFTTTQAFGFDPIDDQQLAGLIMWVPASVPYVAAGLWRLLTMLRQPQERGV